jgi:predicted dienelactone hydrolase
MDRVAVAGHSFGGRTALALVGARFDGPRQARECAEDDHDRRCRALPVFGADAYRYRDPRVKAALLIAPAGFKFYRADGIAEVDVPVLVVGADDDHTTPYHEFSEAIYRSLNTERYLLPLTSAGHLTATDICHVVDSIGMLAKTFGGERAQDGCGEGFLPPEDALEIVSAAALPFFDRYLNGDYQAEERLLAATDPGEVNRRILAALSPRPAILPTTNRRPTRTARSGDRPRRTARRSADRSEQ